MQLILGILGVALVVFIQYRILRAIVQRTPSLKAFEKLIFTAFIAWIVVTCHRAAIWIPQVGAYDGFHHELIARATAEDLLRGATSIFDLSFISNDGYRNMLGLFYAATSAPEFLSVAIHGALAFSGLLILLETISIAIRGKPIPKWLILYTLFLPSALIFTPWLLKEAPALWGIAVIMRFAVSVNYRKPTLYAIAIFALGAFAVFSMRPHIGGAWLVAIAISKTLSVQRPMYALVGLFGAILAYGITMEVAEILRPGFNENVEEHGLVGTLDGMTNHAQGGSAIYRSATPIPFINGLVFILFEPNPLYWSNLNYAIVGFEAIFISYMIFRTWLPVRNKLTYLLQPNALMCICAVLFLAFYLGYMYNMGLMVRQRLQVMPALILLAALPLGLSKNGKTA